MSPLDAWLALRLPRERCALRHLVASWAGFFWLPCPCCGEDFAGFEVGQRHVDHEAVPGGGWISQGCCRWCDACPGAEREQAELEHLIGAQPADGIARLLHYGPTPPEWRCGP